MTKTSTNSINDPKTELSEEDMEKKREKRRAINRRSARKSRYREMVMIDELQRQVRELSAKNAALRNNNKALEEMTVVVISRVKLHEEEKQRIAAARLGQQNVFGVLSSMFLMNGQNPPRVPMIPSVPVVPALAAVGGIQALQSYGTDRALLSTNILSQLQAAMDGTSGRSLV